jgi:hypothetical protein
MFTRVGKEDLWALWGVAAGLLGVVTNVVLDDQSPRLKEAQPWDAAVVGQLDRSLYHLGVLTGFAAIACVVLFASGWRRWAERRTASLAGGGVATALTVSAGAMLVGYGLRGGLAEYLPGGSNDDNFSADALLSLFVLNDSLGWYAWWGVIVSAGLCGWLGLRERVLPVWVGAAGALAVVPPLLAAAFTGAVAVAGLVGPLWLVVLGLGLTLSGGEPRTREVPGSSPSA